MPRFKVQGLASDKLTLAIAKARELWDRTGHKAHSATGHAKRGVAKMAIDTENLNFARQNAPRSMRIETECPQAVST